MIIWGNKEQKKRIYFRKRYQNIANITYWVGLVLWFGGLIIGAGTHRYGLGVLSCMIGIIPMTVSLTVSYVDKYEKKLAEKHE